jgi:hypothetical protein
MLFIPLGAKDKRDRQNGIAISCAPRVGFQRPTQPSFKGQNDIPGGGPGRHLHRRMHAPQFASYRAQSSPAVQILFEEKRRVGMV